MDDNDDDNDDAKNMTKRKEGEREDITSDKYISGIFNHPY
jgi:hypothetical protein